MTDSRPWEVGDLDESAYRALAADLPASQLWSLLLDVMERRASQRKPADVAERWMHDRFVQPSHIDQRVFHEIDRHLLAAARNFEAIELSPVTPLGTCTAVALTTQQRVLSTVRGTEVVSDPTNVLALESARRLRENLRQTVRLATSHRCLRAQAVPNRPGFAAHFRMFCLTSAGHELPDRRFVVDQIQEHIRVYLDAMDRLDRHGYRIPPRSLRILSTRECEPLRDRIAAAVSEVPVTMGALEHEYYHGLRFMIDVGNTRENIPFVDGGVFDWVAKLAANNKLVFVASAMGTQLAAHLFRASDSQ